MTSTSPISVAAIPWILRLLHLAWAGFWTWFVIMASGWESPPPPWWIPTLWLGTLFGTVVAAWKWPLVGGPLLVGVAAATAVFFNSHATRLILSAPALVLGIGFSLWGWYRLSHPTA
jgi:hypothetical protein